MKCENSHKHRQYIHEWMLVVVQGKGTKPSSSSDMGVIWIHLVCGEVTLEVLLTPFLGGYLCEKLQPLILNISLRRLGGTFLFC